MHILNANFPLLVLFTSTPTHKLKSTDKRINIQFLMNNFFPSPICFCVYNQILNVVSFSQFNCQLSRSLTKQLFIFTKLPQLGQAPQGMLWPCSRTSIRSADYFAISAIAIWGRGIISNRSYHRSNRTSI